MFLLFIVIYMNLSLFNVTLSSLANTLVFSAGPNSYVAFDSWRPCLNGYVRFDIRTNAHDGTLAYIDDQGKFDFFYLKLIEGKLRLLFNLGNDRQALNVNTKINDNQWHTILVKRDGPTTLLSIDNGLVSNSTITHSADLYFGGSTPNEYQASSFYFGGIPVALERPSSGNLSSFDVYMQPRFRGQLRNLIYKNCTNSHLVQPVHLKISGGVYLTPTHQCSGQKCGIGLCLITDTSYKCLCDETDYHGEHCEHERKAYELTFNGKNYLRYNLSQSILSLNEIIQLQFKTNHYNGLLFQLNKRMMRISLKQGQIAIECYFNHQWYESTTKDLYLIDNQWHYVQIKRKHGQITMMIDEHHLQFETDIEFDYVVNLTDIFIAGNNKNELLKNFHGCLKDISLVTNDSFVFNISDYFLNQQANKINLSCSSLLNPIEFLIPLSFISFELSENIQQMNNYQLNISFHFQTYSSDAIILYSNNELNTNFLGFDLIDGFLYLTINLHQAKRRQELFQQRLNNGQTHFIDLSAQGYQGGLELKLTMNHRQSTRIIIRGPFSKIHLHRMTIGGIDPNIRWFPNNYWSGIMYRGLIGCFFDLHLNNEAINLTKYINYTNNNMSPRSGPCSTMSSSKHECLCEHGGECRLANGGIRSCDCSRTGYTGRRCEHATYHFDLNEIDRFEVNTHMQWSEQTNDIAFGLQAMQDHENFLQFRACQQSIRCDSINFSIRNGLLNIDFHFSNLTINILPEHSFILDNQWHYIHMHRIDNKLLLHIDHHIAQRHVNIIEPNVSLLSTIWLNLNGGEKISIEDLRVYDQSINSKFFLNNHYEQIQLKHRPWKPLHSISFHEQYDSSISIPLNDVLCQECELDTIYFEFRTTELTGLLLFANIQTNGFQRRIQNYGQYLVIKLEDGKLHLIVLLASVHEHEDEIHQIQTKTSFNDGQWHHISLHRGSDYHLELIINSQKYYLLTSVHFVDTIYFGRPSFLSSDILSFNHINTLKTCIASLKINSRSINLREYVRSNSQIRNDCFLRSQCPLRYCQNTGICHDHIKCDCRHTSFQGKFCTKLRLGYFFNEYTPGLIFDQPFQSEKKLLNYRISFGIVTKTITGEIIRISDLIQIELYRGHVRVKLTANAIDENEFIENNIMISDGYYHLIQVEYNVDGNLYLNVDNKSILKRLTYQLSFDKPLLLLIGQNPAFKHGFQGQLYGLESDIYSVFEMISPTFHRISYSATRNTMFPSPSPSSSIIYPSSQTQNDATPSYCTSEINDDICTVTLDKTMSSLAYPNVTLLTSLSTYETSSLSSSFSTERISRHTILSSIPTLSYQDWKVSTLLPSNYAWNATIHNRNSSLIVSTRSSISNSFRKLFHWQYSWFILVPIVCALTFCCLCSIVAFIKYRRKDVGVYEVEEAQRFRPLIVELTPSPGERNQENTNSITTSLTKPLTKHLSKNDSIESHKKRKRKKPPFTTTDEQREFYI